MTVTDDTTQLEATESDEHETPEDGESAEDAAKRGRDFTKVRDYHEQLANFINDRSGLEPVTANQVKAVLALRTDYGNTDEAKQARAERAAQRKAEASKYEGMSEAQKTAAKASNRATLQAQRLQAKADEAVKRAAELAAQASGSGEDLQAVVEAQQNGEDSNEDGLVFQEPTDSEDAPKKRSLGRRR